jgi:hypothetical protein
MRIQKRFIASALFMLAVLSLTGSAFAQEAPLPPKKPAPESGDVIVYERELIGPQHGPGIRTPAPPGLPMGDDTLVFLSSEMSFGGKVVKGAPYTAQAITESTRTLGDGNKIRHKNTASVYRDNEGRTRRDQELGTVGPWAMSGDPHQMIFIHDPVAGANYVLDPRTRIARKMRPLRLQLTPGEISGIATGSESKVRFRIEKEEAFTASAPPPPHTHAGGPPLHEFNISVGPRKGVTESLGKQTIEGVMAEGTRTTVTIPAGEVGNEQPIQIVWEKWYSPELQTVVMSKHSDPFVGENVYRLTNIVRGEPSRTLFEVPSDYTVKEMPGGHARVLRKRSNEEK